MGLFSFTDVSPTKADIKSMVLLYKAQANTVILTLTEKMVDASKAFAFRLTNDSSGEVKVFAAPDESASTGRCNRFTWTENATESLHTGTVSLSEGQWTYEAFEVSRASPSTITLGGSENLLETGRVIVKDAPEADDYFDPADATDKFYTGS